MLHLTVAFKVIILCSSSVLWETRKICITSTFNNLCELDLFVASLRLNKMTKRKYGKLFLENSSFLPE